jgi:hypothetical protein
MVGAAEIIIASSYTESISNKRQTTPKRQHRTIKDIILLNIEQIILILVLTITHH